MTAQAEVAHSDVEAARTRRPGVRLAAMLVWVAAVAVWWWRFGIPNDSITVMITLWLGTVAWNIEAHPREHLNFLKDWWLPAALLTFYFFSRGLTDELKIPVHWTMPIDVDRWLGFGTTPTEHLQAAWCGDPCTKESDPRWYDVGFTFVYASHFLTGLTLAVVLWVRNHAEWQVWMRRFVGLNFGGLLIYISYPMAPPWLASDEGYLGPVERLTSRGWRDIGLQRVDVILNGVGNPVAAMPSLHFGTAFLIALYAAWRLRSPLRWALFAYPVAMGLALVYYGEHYVVDLIAGGALAGLVMVLCRRWERRREDRAEVQATADDVRV
ncbi:phosphatase PAP2 family protein [Nocardioides sp. 503]|uniref:phosphatase PAP2 family protein n=1 Tax=Nocardioides sp. 503 TaxID=2508326 RepID=UPI00106F5F1E|nr:phosphatase PAP2 family protein [Nocardioides sp. 503]